MVVVVAVLVAMEVNVAPGASVMLLLLLYDIAVEPSDDEFLLKAAGSVVMELDEVIVAKSEAVLSSNEVIMVSSEEVTDRVNEVVGVEELDGEPVKLAEEALEGRDINKVASPTTAIDFVLLLTSITELPMLVVDPPGDTGVSDPIVSDEVADSTEVTVESAFDAAELDVDEASNADKLSD